MFSLLLSFARQHVMASLTAVAVLLLATACLFEKHQAASARQELLLARAEGESLSLSNAALLASLKEQNRAIAAMQVAAKAKMAKAEKALDVAKLQARKYQKRVQDIRSIAISPDECGQLIRLLKAFGKL